VIITEAEDAAVSWWKIHYAAFTLSRWNLTISPTLASGSERRSRANNMHFSLSSGFVSDSSIMLNNMLWSADRHITQHICLDATI